MTRRLRGAHVARVQSPWGAFLAQSVWKLEDNKTDPDATARFWLPLFDVVMILAGVWASVFGSPILHRLFPTALVDVAGIGMALAAGLALVGVVVPRLAMLELLGKLLLIFFLGSYTACVAFFPADGTPSNGFLVLILIGSLFLVYPRVRRLLRNPDLRHDLRVLRRPFRRARRPA